MKKKTIEKIPFFGKKKIHRLGDCFIIDGKWIDGKTNNINARICLREHEYANYIEGVGWNTKCLESWWKYSDDQFKVELELSKKEKKELSDFSLLILSSISWICLFGSVSFHLQSFFLFCL